MTGMQPALGGGEREVAGLVAAFDSGDSDVRAGLFYNLLHRYGVLGQVAATAGDLVDAAVAAREVAEDTLAAERQLHAQRLGGLAARVAELEGQLGAERKKSRALAVELSAARGEIRDLTEANSMLGDENAAYALREARGELQVRGVAGFTFVGRLWGGTAVFAQTPGRPKANVTARVEGMALVVSPRQTGVDLSAFGVPAQPKEPPRPNRPNRPSRSGKKRR